MKRRGFLLLEMLLGLLISAMLAAAAMPAVGAAAEYAARLTGRMRAQEDAFFAADYMTDRIRYCLDRTEPAEAPMETYIYAYEDYDEDGRIQTYWFIAGDGRWKNRLYNGRSHPLTGDQDSLPEYALSQAEEGGRLVPYVTVYPHGLVRMAYKIGRNRPAAAYTAVTSVLPLRDYFLVGEVYE